ncbi:LysR substrate-binding domain-containing protein [Pelagibius sp.]|uniref:LysR family transcriptional regulator n=1 Tax=Pelagibius sp. TaxID=1931238 RepID=UPI002621A9A8|nr:LysR substrate-binding domain-containing protein [Pelagibius sp.]
MSRNLDIGLARAFLAVADSGNMTTAAARLNLTQGAVSQQIKRLEEAFQCMLFDRTRRGLTLTRSGEALLGPAKRLLDLNDEIWREMTAPAIRGTVRLGMPVDLIAPFLPPVLEGFVEANPQIEVSLVSATSPELLRRLGGGDIDLALVEEPLGRSAGECLCVERLLWIGARNGRALGKRPLPLSIVSEDCAFRPAIFEALRKKRMAWRTVFENGTIEATLTTVRADLAVTALLASTIPSDLEVLGRDSGLPELPSFAINLHRRPEPSPAALEVARHLRDGLLANTRRSA